MQQRKRVYNDETGEFEEQLEEEPAAPVVTPEDVMREMGRKGGKSRARKMTTVERSTAAKRAADVRWGRERKEKP